MSKSGDNIGLVWSKIYMSKKCQFEVYSTLFNSQFVSQFFYLYIYLAVEFGKVIGVLLLLASEVSLPSCFNARILYNYRM